MSFKRPLYKPWEDPETMYQQRLVEDVEEFLDVDWNSLDLRLRRLYIALGRIIKVRAFEQWLNMEFLYTPGTDPASPISLILDGRIEFLIEWVNEYAKPGFS